jgi:hypothetical protein
MLIFIIQINPQFESKPTQPSSFNVNSANTSTNASMEISTPNETAEVIVASGEVVHNAPHKVTQSQQLTSLNNTAADNEDLGATLDLDALKPNDRVFIRLQQSNTNTEFWNATILKQGSNKRHGQFQIRFDGQKKSSFKWVNSDEIVALCKG